MPSPKRPPSRKRSSRPDPRVAPAAFRDFDPWVELPLLTCLFLGPWLAAFDGEVAGRWLDAALGLCGLVCGGLVVIRARRIGLRAQSPMLVLGLWLLLAVAATVLTVDRGYSIGELARLLGAACALVIPLMADVRDRRAVLYRVALAVTAGGVIAAASGLAQWLRNAVYLGAYDWRTFGTFSNPNALAGYLALVTPSAVALACLARERSFRVLGWFVVAVMACAVPLTQSRAGLGSFLLGLFLFALLAMPGSVGRRLKVAVGGFVILVAALMAIPSLRMRLLTTFTVNHSLMFRLYCWKAAWVATLERPLLGWGLGTYPIAHSAVAEVGPTLHAHQDMLHVAAEAGLPAALLLAAGLVWGLLRACRASPLGRPHHSHLLPVGVGCGVAAVVAHGLLESDLTVRPTLVALFALLGSESAACQATGSRSSRWLGVPTLCVGLCVLAVSVAMALSGTELRRAEASELRGRVAAAARHYDRALAWYPWDTTPLRRKLSLDPASVPDLEGAFEAVLATNPCRAVSHEALADCLVRVGEFQRAAPHYSRAVELAPTRVMSLLGLATSAADRGDMNGVLAFLLRVRSLEAAPYGRYRAVPEMLTLEFVYPRAAVAELQGPGTAAFKEGLEALDAYLRTYEKLLAQFSMQYEDDQTLVALNLSMRGLKPRTVAQARMMRARLRWMEAEAAGDATAKQALRNEALESDPAAVHRMDQGAWRGILVETAHLRAEGGL